MVIAEVEREADVLDLAALGVVLGACSGSSGSADGDAGIGHDASEETGADGGLPQVPRVDVVDCRYDVPENLGLEEGTDYECGDLEVFENRDNPGRVIRVRQDMLPIRPLGVETQGKHKNRRVFTTRTE